MVAGNATGVSIPAAKLTCGGSKPPVEKGTPVRAVNKASADRTDIPC
jgi:hypothetical protein